MRSGKIALMCSCSGWLALASAGLGVVATSASAETLTQALGATYRYNPQIDAQRARLRATDEQVAIANSGYRPRITAHGDLINQHITSSAAGAGSSPANS